MNRTYLLLVALLASVFLLVKKQINYVKENDLLRRELYGVYKQIDDGRFTKTVIKTREIRINIDKIITKTVYLPPEGHATITSKDPSKKLEDVVDIKYIVRGFVFEPGFQFSVFPLGGGIDAKIIYWNRLGVSAGFGYFKHLYYPDSVSPTGAITYRLDRIPFVHNTELFVGAMPLPILSGYAGFRWGL